MQGASGAARVIDPPVDILVGPSVMHLAEGRERLDNVVVGPWVSDCPALMGLDPSSPGCDVRRDLFPDGGHDILQRGVHIVCVVPGEHTHGRGPWPRTCRRRSLESPRGPR